MTWPFENNTNANLVNHIDRRRFGWLFVSNNFRENRNLRTISISVSNLGIACFCYTTHVCAGTLLNIRHPFYAETIISRAN